MRKFSEDRINETLAEMAHMSQRDIAIKLLNLRAMVDFRDDQILEMKRQINEYDPARVLP